MKTKTSNTGGAKKASTTQHKQPLVQTKKAKAMDLNRNKQVSVKDVKRIQKAVSSSATAPKTGKFKKFIGQ